jgi:uncharacterized repeat protein (TIGR03803 family)
MKSIRFPLPLLVALAISFIPITRVGAQTFTTLANFNYNDGSEPRYGSLVQATDGNYYGTTNYGGKNGSGAIFKVTPTGRLTAIYSFCSQANCADGASPWSAPVLGSDGNLYGTAYVGGSEFGAIFKINLRGVFTKLYTFCPSLGCTDGAFPVGLMQASNGVFYGATNGYGADNEGTLFEISSAGKFKSLYSFCSESNCADGAQPLSGPVQANNGNLYGTTNYGGAQNYGTVYELTPTGQFKTLYSFCSLANCADGSYPFGALSQAADGKLYGTTNTGGANGAGTVFEITTTGELMTLYSFDGTVGGYPISAPVQASDGNLYGVTSANDLGGATIYEITSAGVFSTLDSFCSTSNCIAGSPLDRLAQVTNGEFIGTTYSGGKANYGTIYSFSTGLGPLVETGAHRGQDGQARHHPGQRPNRLRPASRSTAQRQHSPWSRTQKSPRRFPRARPPAQSPSTHLPER